MAISQGQKNRNPLHHSQTNRETQQKERKMKKKRHIRFDLGVIVILQRAFHQNNNILSQ